MYEVDKQKFGSFVAQLRKEKGLTQKDLADRLYISNKAISKWETGVSIPDVALLIPLSEVLDVTVTELLHCQRLEEPLNPTQVETVVKQAINYADPPAKRSLNKKQLPAYLFCLLLGFAETVLMYLLDRWGYLTANLTEMLQVTLVLCPLFGFYFMLAAKERLPAYYDENRINAFSDGPFRMNIPGVTFNNHNWPYIVKAGQRWYMLMMVGYPALHLLVLFLVPEFWLLYDKIVGLVFMLGLLFIPIVIAAKKHEYA